WGLREHWDGYVRLTNLDEVIRAGRERIGVSASLVPEGGTGGPFVIDWGEHLRLLILDTAWWMLAGDVPDKRMVLDSLSVVDPGAGDREVMMMAHHPFRSAGPHGGQFSFWRTIGVRYLLFRSGAILQDLTSEPFRE